MSERLRALAEKWDAESAEAWEASKAKKLRAADRVTYQAESVIWRLTAKELRALLDASPEAETAPRGQDNVTLAERILDIALCWPVSKRLLDAPCIFCGYNGSGYYQTGTHTRSCPWHQVGGSRDREVQLPQRFREVLTFSLPVAFEPHAPETPRAALVALRDKIFQRRTTPVHEEMFGGRRVEFVDKATVLDWIDAALAQPGAEPSTECAKCGFCRRCGHPFQCCCEQFPEPSAQPGAETQAPPTWQTVEAAVPPRHARHEVRRDGLLFTATPCYGMHEPWWVVRTMNGEAPPVAMRPTDEWRPAAPAPTPERQP